MPGFTKDTGIKVKMRDGGDFELANQLVQEGAASPADVFVTENSPAMTLVDSKGLFAKVDARDTGPGAAAVLPERRSLDRLRGPLDGAGLQHRQAHRAELPSSIMDLAEPAWKGRVGFSPAGADFQAIVWAVVDVEGKAAAATWLTGLKDNGTVYQGNNVVHEVGQRRRGRRRDHLPLLLVQDRARPGRTASNIALHYFGNQDPGAFLSVSGAVSLQPATTRRRLSEFMRYLSSAEGQTALAESTALEYPLNPDGAGQPGDPPLTDLDAPGGRAVRSSTARRSSS